MKVSKWWPFYSWLTFIHVLFVFAASVCMILLLNDAGLRPRTQPHIGELLVDWKIVDNGTLGGFLMEKHNHVKRESQYNDREMLCFTIAKKPFFTLFASANFTFHWHFKISGVIRVMYWTQLNRRIAEQHEKKKRWRIIFCSLREQLKDISALNCIRPHRRGALPCCQ